MQRKEEGKFSMVYRMMKVGFGRKNGILLCFPRISVR